MKKNFFLSGINAKMALALVALTSVVFTSCSKESFEVTTSGLEDAKASATITVYDAESFTVLKTETKDLTANLGTTVSIPCPEMEGYVQQSPVSVDVPTLSKGQYAIIPVTFYLIKVNSALEKVIVTPNPSTAVPDKEEIDVENKNADGSYKFVNESDYIKKYSYSFTMKSGREVVSSTTKSRAVITDEDIVDARIKAYAPGFTDATTEYSGKILAWAYITFEIEQKFTVEEVTFSYGECTKTVKVSTAGEEVISAQTGAIPGFEHSHGHGHGEDSNAGGGIVWAD